MKNIYLYLLIISNIFLIVTNLPISCGSNQNCEINSIGFLTSIFFTIIIQLSILVLLVISIKNCFKYKKSKSLFLTLLVLFLFLGGFPRKIGLILGLNESAFGFEPGISYPYDRFQQIQIVNYLSVFFILVSLNIIYFAFIQSLKKQ